MFTMTQKLGRLARMFGLLSLVAVLGGLLLNATPASAAPKGGGVLSIYVGNTANDVGFANATVVMQHLASSQSIKVLTDAQGYVKIATAAGPYAVTVLADGFETQQILTSVKVGGTTNLTFRLQKNSAGVAPAPQPALGTPKSTLALRVVSAASGRPIANAAILVRDSAGQDVFKGASSAAGELKIEVPQGKYAVMVEVAGGAYKPAKVAVFVDNNPVTYLDVKLELALSTSWPPPQD